LPTKNSGCLLGCAGDKRMPRDPDKDHESFIWKDVGVSESESYELEGEGKGDEGGLSVDMMVLSCNCAGYQSIIPCFSICSCLSSNSLRLCVITAALHI
jgi:hypothetical protein